MSAKSIIVFALIFSTQFLISCIINPCDCDPGIKYQVDYTAGDATALDTSGFQSEEVVDSVHRSSFGIQYRTSFVQEVVSQQEVKSKKGSFGFNSAFACSCVGNTYVYSDPVIDLDIFMINNKTQEEFNANEVFIFYGNASNTSVNEIDLTYHFNQEWYPDAYLSFELVDEEAVLPSSIFKIVLTLESGATLSTQTKVVNFFD